MKQKFKLLSLLLVLSILIGNFSFSDAAKVKISKNSKTMYVGDSFKLKITGTKNKVKWSTSKKSVATVSKGTVKAKKKGKVSITATVNKKRYTCKITVKDKVDQTKQSQDQGADEGSRENPINAFAPFTSDIYDYSTYLGNFEIQLMEYKQGEEALRLVVKDEYDTIPSSTEEYIYLKFSIKYLSGTKPVSVNDVLNYHSDLFNSDSTLNIDNKDWGSIDNGITDMVNVDSMYPGASVICQKAIIINKGNTPITYRIQTGYDKKNYEEVFTWFKTY